MKLWLLSLLAFGCVVVTGASATTLTYDFSTTPGNTTTATYTSNGVSISATSNSSSDLFFKNGGLGETGLGLAGTPENEIGVGQSVTFDLSSLFSQHVTSINMTFDSIQTGEMVQLCDTDGDCVSFGSSADNKAQDISALFAEMKADGSGLVTVSATSGNVLVEGLTATISSVPEPSSLLLMATGILSLAGAARKFVM